MLYSVFGVPDPARQGWKAQLLEHSWRLAGKEGVLTGFLLDETDTRSPSVAEALGQFAGNSSIRGTNRFLGAAYLRAVLGWTFNDRPEGTILILGTDSAFLKPMKRVVAPGVPTGQAWLNSGIRVNVDGAPFGFPAALAFLEEHCTSTERLAVPVRLPVLIHSSDLRRIGARWVELCEIIEQHFAGSRKGFAGRWLRDAINYAFAAVCAEYGIEQRAASLELDTVGSTEGVSDAELICYAEPIWALSGRQIFSPELADPLQFVPEDENLEQRQCREFVRVYNSFVSACRQAEGRFNLLDRPSRSTGVLEGRLCDDILLEKPAEGARLWLNSTGKEVWDLCNSKRTVGDVLGTLKVRYGGADVDIATETISLLDDLRAAGFLTVHTPA